MAKCPKCSTRKGKRPCPALGTEICAPCCAENRLTTIPCPPDCPYLEGELYQHRRRQERAVSRGKDFLATQEKLFPEKASREFAFRLLADVYYFTREHGPEDDESMAAALEALKSSLSRIFVPSDSARPLARFLIERVGDEKRYAIATGFSGEDKRRAVGKLAAHARSLAKDGSMKLHEEISSFFDSLDFEADLDYSPEDAAPEGPGEEAPRRSAGGLILPPGV